MKPPETRHLATGAFTVAGLLRKRMGGPPARRAAARPLPASILIRMHPWIGRDLAGFRQPDHVHGRRVAAFVARTAQSHSILEQVQADIPLPRIRHAFLDFMCDRTASMQSNRAKTMPTAKARACTILAEFDHAQTELVGKAVILTDEIAGTVDPNLAR